MLNKIWESIGKIYKNMGKFKREKNSIQKWSGHFRIKYIISKILNKLDVINRGLETAEYKIGELKDKSIYYIWTKAQREKKEWQEQNRV